MNQTIDIIHRFQSFFKALKAANSFQVIADVISNDFTRPKIHDSIQVYNSLVRLNIGDIRNPNLVLAINVQMLDLIFNRSSQYAGKSCANNFIASGKHQTVFPHQSMQTITTYLDFMNFLDFMPYFAETIKRVCRADYHDGNQNLSLKFHAFFIGRYCLV